MTHTEKDAPAPAPADVAAERFPNSDGGLNQLCAWFVACDNEAVRYRRHPVMATRVPICNRCDCLAEARA